MRTLALMTDFGIGTHFIGLMKGVISKINSEINVIDLAHEIEHFNIRHGQFILKKSLKFFPKDCVFCVVIDPGVGSKRKPLAIKADDHFFIGPDNGVLSPVLNQFKKIEVREITNSSYMENDISITFHGRDIFAPCSAKLATGESFEDVGPIFENYVVLGEIEPVENLHFIEGGIEFIDKFGNIISNISGEAFSQKQIESIKCGEVEAKFVRSYSQGSMDELNCLIGSHGNLEFFIKKKSAQKGLNILGEEKIVISFG